MSARRGEAGRRQRIDDARGVRLQPVCLAGPSCSQTELLPGRLPLPLLHLFWRHARDRDLPYQQGPDRRMLLEAGVLTSRDPETTLHPEPLPSENDSTRPRQDTTAEPALPQEGLSPRTEIPTDPGRALPPEETIDDQPMQTRAGAGAPYLPEVRLLLREGRRPPYIPIERA